MNKYTELPTELVDQFHIESHEVLDKLECSARESGTASNVDFWKHQLTRQIQIERSAAWFREQHFLTQIEGLKRQRK